MIAKRQNLLGVSYDAILLSVTKVITALLGMAVTRLLAEYLSVYDYGTYSQILLLVSLVSSITILGMHDGVNFFYMGDVNAEERDSLVATQFVLQAIVSLFASFLILICSKPLCNFFNNPDLSPLLIFVALLSFLQNLLNMSRALFVAVGKARLLAARNLTVSLIRLLATILIVFFIPKISIVLLLTVLLDVGQLAFFWIILRKNNCRVKLVHARRKMIKRILQYCIPMAIFVVVNTVNRDVDKYFISAYTNTEMLALYTNASKQLPFDILMASYCTILVPYMTKYIADQKYSLATNVYKKFLELSYISTGILCGAAIAASPQLMKLLYSNKYTDGLSIFQVYILNDFLRFTNLTIVLSAAGKTKRLMIIGVGSVAFNIVLNYIFFGWMGMIGPAVATLVVTSISGLLMLSLVAKTLKTRLQCLLSLNNFMLFLTESIILVVALFFFGQYLREQKIHYFVILIIIAGLYSVIMLVFNGKRLILNMKSLNHLPDYTHEK